MRGSVNTTRNTVPHFSLRKTSTAMHRSVVSFEPLGPVLAIMPWNFPYWQVFRFTAPALMAGNVTLLKHASGVCGSALAIENVFREAGFPDDVFTTLIVGSDAVPHIIHGARVRAVTLTGSTAAGRHVAADAGQALKKVVLALGGSDPYLILADADLELSAEKCVTSRLINSGQSCIAAKRFIVQRAVAAEFSALVVEKMAARKVGDPLVEGSDVGPMARTDLRDELHDQVMQSVELGAQCLFGGAIPDGGGAYYPPTVLGAVIPGMPAYGEELFGPVAAIITVHGVDEAIATANDSVYGLGAAVFTRSVPPSLRATSIWPNASSRHALKPDAASSTILSARIRVCRSAASRIPASDVNSAHSASASSST